MYILLLEVPTDTQFFVSSNLAITIKIKNAHTYLLTIQLGSWVFNPTCQFALIQNEVQINILIGLNRVGPT